MSECVGLHRDAGTSRDARGEEDLRPRRADGRNNARQDIRWATATVIRGGAGLA